MVNAMSTKPSLSLDPGVADAAPTADALTPYDMQHLVTYLRLLDADVEGADWTEVARIVLHINPVIEPFRAHLAWQSHLVRAKWMTRHGYQHLLRGTTNHWQQRVSSNGRASTQTTSR
jgi:type VI secretion system activator RovC-like protein